MPADVDQLPDAADIPGARPGRCWAYEGFACPGHVYWPPAGWSGRARVQCDAYTPHSAVVSVDPPHRTPPAEVAPLTAAERRVLAAMRADEEAGL